MSKLNRSTLKQKVADFINRVSPFTDPLIQKTEDNEIRDDFADSQVFKISTVGSINNPAASFTTDFITNDEYNIDSTGSIPDAFSVTIDNLDNNSFAKLNITKKTSQTFTFANGTILPDGNIGDQVGIITIKFLVFKSGTSHFAFPLYLEKKTVKIEAATPQLITKKIDIGDWNMDTTSSVNVAHGLDSTKIIAAYAFIRGDLAIPNNELNDINRGGHIRILSDGVNATVERDAGGVFDNASFDLTPFNRGFTLFLYEE